MADSCATCFFFGPNQSASFPASCRFRAPGILNLPSPVGAVPNWPPVASTDWCGDFNVAGKTPTAWTTYTPTITAEVGTLTSYSVSIGRYFLLNRSCFLHFLFTITDNGTGSQAIDVTYPPAVSMSTGIVQSQVGVAGRGSDGKMCKIFGYPTSMSIKLYDGTYPASTGELIEGNFWFETD